MDPNINDDNNNQININNMDLNNNNNNYRLPQDIYDYPSSQGSSSSFNDSPARFVHSVSNTSSPTYGAYDDVIFNFDLKTQPSSLIKTNDNYNNCFQSSPNSAFTNYTNSNDDRTQTRRLKNRESAARSRQKIKNLLQKLTIEQKQLLNHKHALDNEKSLALNEIDRIESKMLDMKITTISKNEMSSPAQSQCSNYSFDIDSDIASSQ